MLQQKIMESLKGLENADYPLLGPNLTGLYWFGLWQGDHKYRDAIFSFIHGFSMIFVVTQFLELYFMEKDLMKVLFNVTISALAIVTICKTLFFLFYLKEWKTLVKNISIEEIQALATANVKVVQYMRQYRNYSRVTTFFYWTIMFTTTIVTVILPFLKFTSPTFGELIRNGTESYPQVLSSWFPFDSTEMPGYLVSVIIHIIVVVQGSGVIAVYDSNNVSIMSFLRWQMLILKYKCEMIFFDDGMGISRERAMNNIKECHRLHNFFIEQYKMFNRIISPVMFVYVLVCSIMICCSVVQFNLDSSIPKSQKLWIIQYTTAISIQLFLYCWHSNEIAHDSKSVDIGVYSSRWWLGDVQLRRHILLLAGKLAPTFILDAGPFNKFSMTTFINILKGSYSFYTLFTKK